MMSVAAGIILAGYTLAYWGMETLHGCGVGFADLLVPGRYSGCNPSAPRTPDPDARYEQAPGSGPSGTQGGAGGRSPVSPPSTEGYMSRTPKR